MKDIGVGLIGSGFMGKCHAMAWRSVGGVFAAAGRPKLAHLAEVNAEFAQDRATEFGFEKGSGDWRAVIADPKVDVVSLTAPNQFHAEIALAALAAGKHLWCEKPMAPSFAEAEAMAEAAKNSGKVVALGYNYIQSPAIRQIGALLTENRIGVVNHLRIEMDEDFMADPEIPFNWKHDAKSGYGALDDFAVHPLSLVSVLFGRVARVVCDMAKPHAERTTADGQRRAVETWDIANVLMRLESGLSATLQVNRSAWGRKGRISAQIFGSKGTILFDQERFNEFQLYLTADRPAEQGFRTVLTGPQHEPYAAFIPAPGHGLGFNELKIIECRELIARIRGEAGTRLIGFDEGLEIERTVHAMALSFQEGGWVNVR
ncbi:Gfo/Idh/MocA family protein [Manganibacter manganicus]|uniref:Myo-inositol 2-dehydrogenase n=1 Tax=Manganibacter manganicus TaxID=1873176 RepID=A0A1V8RVR3_9HYPH|nr:Gfo/Idh/MocA family oxidoreductase [Pseudaminobacter manganicus]OQM77233.1 myo-inositol 2-dehydrogenase [Pseudaminobacter manganicus]